MKAFVLLALTLIGASPVAAANTDSVLGVPRTAGAPQLANFLDMSPFLHHGTALYVGYNGNLQNIDARLQTTARGLARTRNVFMNDSKQFFVKFSYLVRF